MLGKIFKVSVFGESHGNGIGCVIEGIPPGTTLDIALIEKRMSQRKPGQGKHTTNRQEADSFEILSGYFEGVTTGTPLCMMIRNKDTRSDDYKKTGNLLRPSHADFTGNIKYAGANDIRGGGHFSARLTAPLVFAGAIAEQLLSEKGIEILTHIKQVGGVECSGMDADLVVNAVRAIEASDILVLNEFRDKILEEVEAARIELDSVGGIVETVVNNVPVGIGEPIFDTVEGVISYAMFGIPAVKAVSFGNGFDFANMRGSAANDSFIIEDGKIKTATNHNGGVNGGISNGMPILFRCAFKPTPSIARPQRTVDIEAMKEDVIEIVGRHDPCVAIRGAVVVKAVTAIAVYDLMRRTYGHG